VEGFFSRIGGVVRQGLAAVDQRTGRVLSWNAHLREPLLFQTGTEERGIALQGTTIYMGGYGWAVDTRTGKQTAWNPQPDYIHGDPSISTVAPAGKVVFVSGIFMGIAGTDQGGFAELDAKTGKLIPFHPHGADNPLVGHGKLYLSIAPPACG